MKLHHVIYDTSKYLTKEFFREYKKDMYNPRYTENKELKKEISNYKRRVTNLKKTRILKGTKEQKQIIKVKLGASTKTTVRKHLKKEIEEVKSND